MSKNYIEEKVQELVSKENLIGRSIEELKSTLGLISISEDIIKGDADKQQDFINETKRQISQKINDSKTKLLADIKLIFEQSASNIRDIVIISNIDFTSEEGKKILSSYDDFSNIVFKRCKFGEIKGKNFYRSVFDGCRFTGNIIDSDLSNAAFEEPIKQDYIFEEKENPIKVINCTFTSALTSFTPEQFDGHFHGMHCCSDNCIEKLYKKTHEEYTLNKNYQTTAQYEQFKKSFVAHQSYHAVGMQEKLLIEAFCSENSVDANGNIVLNTSFKETIKGSKNIPINAELDMSSYNVASEIYRATNEDISKYNVKIKKDIENRIKQINIILGDLNHLKTNIDFMSSLISLLSLVESFKDMKNERNYENIFTELYEFIKQNDSFIGLLNKESRLVIQLIMDKKSVELKSFLSPKLFDDLTQNLLKYRACFTQKRKDLNIQSFKDYLKEVGKVNEQTKVELFYLELKENLDYLDFSDCSLKWVEFNSNNSFKYINFTNCVLDFCQSTGKVGGFWESRKEVNMQGCIFDEAVILNSTFKVCNLKGSSFFNTVIKSSNFESSDLSQADCSRLFASHTKAENIIAHNSDFQGSKLIKMSFDYSNFKNSNFRDAFLYKVSLLKARIIRCNFEKAYLDKVDASYANFQECILRDTEKLVLEGVKAYFELCDIRKNKLMELGKNFNTQDLNYTQEDLKNMSPTMQQEFKGALIREANRNFYVGMIGRYGKYISDFLPEQVQTTMRLLAPILKQKKFEFQILAGVTIIAAIVTGVVAEYFPKKKKIAIKAATAGLYICYLCYFLYQFYGIKLVENDAKVLEMNTVTSDFRKGLDKLKEKLNQGPSQVIEGATKTEIRVGGICA